MKQLSFCAAQGSVRRFNLSGNISLPGIFKNDFIEKFFKLDIKLSCSVCYSAKKQDYSHDVIIYGK